MAIDHEEHHVVLSSHTHCANAKCAKCKKKLMPDESSLVVDSDFICCDCISERLKEINDETAGE